MTRVSASRRSRSLGVSDKRPSFLLLIGGCVLLLVTPPAHAQEAGEQAKDLFFQGLDYLGSSAAFEVEVTELLFSPLEDSSSAFKTVERALLKGAGTGVYAFYDTLAVAFEKLEKAAVAPTEPKPNGVVLLRRSTSIARSLEDVRLEEIVFGVGHGIRGRLRTPQFNLEFYALPDGIGPQLKALPPGAGAAMYDMNSLLSILPVTDRNRRAWEDGGIIKAADESARYGVIERTQANGTVVTAEFDPVSGLPLASSLRQKFSEYVTFLNVYRKCYEHDGRQPWLWEGITFAMDAHGRCIASRFEIRDLHFGVGVTQSKLAILPKTVLFDHRQAPEVFHGLSDWPQELGNRVEVRDGLYELPETGPSSDIHPAQKRSSLARRGALGVFILGVLIYWKLLRRRPSKA